VNRDEALPVRYVDAVVREHRNAECHFEGSVHSVYFGGGTPSALPAPARERLCAWLSEMVLPQAAPTVEVTLEANPESATRQTLRPWVEAGVNRISVGVQSMDGDTLRFLGRTHAPEDNRRALDVATSLVDNVSADLILATPGADWASTRASLSGVIEAGVTHVSAYLLEIHADTRFGRDVSAGRWAPAPDARQTQLYLKAAEWLQARGLAAYELSNFARDGFTSRHNARYWRREPYLGLGASAHSFAAERRWSNVRSATRYCEAIESGRSPRDFVEELTASDRVREEVLLGLRTREGIGRERLAGKQRLVEALVAEGLLELDATRVQATLEGWLLLDAMVSQLVE
jgi:oxygen-independent coproporphyrinogen-3 oxidase